jgi:hypothetical protein
MEICKEEEEEEEEEENPLSAMSSFVTREQ